MGSQCFLQHLMVHLCHTNLEANSTALITNLTHSLTTWDETHSLATWDETHSLTIQDENQPVVCGSCCPA